MPARFLSDDQRKRYASFSGPPSPNELAQYFHLDGADLEVIADLRGDHNRLGFALMLGTARFLGAFPGAADEIPDAVMAFLMNQLGLKEMPNLAGYFDNKNGQRFRHLLLIRQRYGFTEFSDNGAARFRLTRWLYALCWSGDDHPGPLAGRAVSWLIANKILLPGVSVLERFVGRIRDRAQKRLWKRLVAALSNKQQDDILQLFRETGNSAFAALDHLRTLPAQRSPGEFQRHLDRLDAIRAFGLRLSPPGGVPVTSLERLARVARMGKPSAIAALQEPRRTATVAALFYTLESAAQDAAAELAEALIADMIREAETAEEKARLRRARDLDDAALLLRDMGKLVMKDDALPLNEWRDALFLHISRDRLSAAMDEIDEIARPRNARPYPELRARWRKARRLFLSIVTRLTMDASPGGKTVLGAMAYLARNTDWSKSKMDKAPTEAIPKIWHPYVLDDTGQVADSRAYVFSMIEAWRSAIKRRDIFIRPGLRYGDPRHGMLDGALWQASKLVVCRALNRSLDAETEIATLTKNLDDAWRTVSARAKDNADLRLETVEGKSRIVVTPLDRLEETESLRTLRRCVQDRMPKAGMPDLFLEIMHRTGFASSFTHLSERQARVENFEISLSAVLVAEACNIGIEAVSRQDVPALRRDRLIWISQNFVRPETIAAANAQIVSAHAALPLVRIWGTGDVASADGMRFTAPSAAIHAGPNPKYFGPSRGVTWYNLMSDQFSGLNGLVVPGTLRDSLVLLALLLEQETGIEPVELMTDTAAYSDAVFGLFWLLGYQFSPRLADLGDARLWRIDPKADYGPFNSLGKHSINLSLIRENWPDVIRLAGSLKLGHLKATGIMRTLQVRDQPTSLARALSELGRIAKTIHILHYIDDPAFRRRILTQLNHTELRHRLGRRIHHGERGEIRSPLQQGQEEQLGALGLALNIVVHWNAIYMQEAIRQIRETGMDAQDEDIRHISPLTWRHLNFLGRYDFSLPDTVRNGNLRPLRNPTSAWDF